MTDTTGSSWLRTQLQAVPDTHDEAAPAEAAPEGVDPARWALQQAATGVMIDPEDAGFLIDPAKVELGADGKPDPTSAAALVAELLKAKPYFAAAGYKPVAVTRDFDAGARTPPPAPGPSMNQRIRRAVDNKRFGGNDAA